MCNASLKTLVAAARILGALVLVFAVGCDRSRTASQPSSTPTSKVRFLIDWKADTTYAGFYLAKELGLFEKRGVDVEIVQGTGAMTSATMIGAGTQYFIGSCSGEATVIARSKGVPIRSVAVLYPDVPTVLYSRKAAPILNPADLKNKRIGLVEGSIGVHEFNALLAANKIDPSTVTVVSAGTDPAFVLTGRLDGLESYEEAEATQLQLQGQEITILRFRDWGVSAYSLNIIVNEGSLRQHAREIKAIVEASIEAYELIRTSPDKAAQTFHRLFPEMPEPFVRESMKVVARNLGKEPVGRQTLSGWTRTAKLLTDVGVVAKSPVAADLVVSEFVLPQ